MAADEPSSPTGPFTGRRRRLRTTFRAKVAEAGARAAATAGGFGAIAAVLTILGVLVAAVAPLFGEATLEPAGTAPAEAQEAPLLFGVDEHRTLAYALSKDGVLEVRTVEDGRRVERRDLFPGGARPTAATAGLREGRFGFGFADGSLRFGDLTFASRIAEAEELPPELRLLEPGAAASRGPAIVRRLPDGRFRETSTSVVLEEPIVGGAGGAIALLDEASSNAKRSILVLRADGTLAASEVRERTNLMTGAVRRTLEEAKLPYAPPSDGARPFKVLLTGLGDAAYVAFRDGRCLRFDLRDLSKPRLAEALDLTGGREADLTDLRFVIGGETLVASDATGRSSAWFRVRPEGVQTSDGTILVEAHVLESYASPAVASSASQRSRLFATAHADGAVRVHHVTTNRVVARSTVPPGAEILAVKIAPKNDAVVVLTRSGIARFELDAAYVDATPEALFAANWYEGEDRPRHVWQSSSGSDSFEPKFGLWPLIFGTLKGTLLSLLLAVPVALLAAVYTSEFLPPTQKALVKPAVEMMASLPSVVLGFVAALVLAPLVDRSAAAVMAGFVVLPLSLLVGAHVWQSLPERATRGRSAFVKLAAAALALACGVAACPTVGALVESACFDGNLKLWLDGRVGGPFGGWLVLLFPPAAGVTAVLFGRVVTPALRARSVTWTRRRAAGVDALKFLAGLLVSLGVAALGAGILSAFGADPRGSLVGTYVQRNALVVGFVMGFAIIPIIFTIAEDALSSVPASLRSASLGAGATPWQTAVRVVVPTAMSGLFSALMVGLGRAVGETMIVLMAAGNTPVMELNPFNGFRTLSANIAVELPEAVHGGPHYRVLFLAAGALFVATFVLNTSAEFVRRRFRARAYQL